MVMHPSLLFAVFLALPANVPSAALRPPEDDVRARFEALDDKHDVAGIVQLWKDHPADTLGVIDSYLEGSLSKLERDPKVDPALLAAMRARALRGALAADQAFQTAIFADYASAFAGFSAEEQKRFREGQALFHEASSALHAGSLKDGLEKARTSWERARPLGDWWGSAMALGAMARAELTLGEYGHALEHACQARQIDHDLRLIDSEYGDLIAAGSAADGLERWDRQLVLAQSGLALARQYKDQDRQAQFFAQIARAQDKLGDKAGAEKTREEFNQLQKPDTKPLKPGGK